MNAATYNTTFSGTAQQFCTTPYIPRLFKRAHIRLAIMTSHSPYLSMQNYEVEVKSLLGSAERATEVMNTVRAKYPDCTRTSKNKQLNHYFEGGDLSRLAEATASILSVEGAEKMRDLVARANTFSIRTRYVQKGDGSERVILVVKASVGADTSANGVSRLEFEETVPLSLSALDDILLQAGFSYQAKWSREREEYTAGGVTICMDKNAGYGYLAEFEKVVDSPEKADAARADIDAFMASVGATELPQDRLERMFAYYNMHWQDFYGTEKIFDIQ